MKLIKPSYEIIVQPPGIEGLYSIIERCGRVCYKSEDKITEDSAKRFVDGLIKSGHTSVLEHGIVYLTFKSTQANVYNDRDYTLWQLANSPYSDLVYSKVTDSNYITTNYRVIIENNAEYLLELMTDPTEYHIQRYTVKFTCDLATHNSFRTYRTFARSSEAEIEYEMSGHAESTRYCNYIKDKFDNQLTFIIPPWLEIKEGEYIVDWDIVDDIHFFGWAAYLNCNNTEHLVSEWIAGSGMSAKERFLCTLDEAQDSYFDLINRHNWTAQQARTVLPYSTKTELIMTGNESQWNYFFSQRTAVDAHPQARELAIPLKEEFKRLNYIKDGNK